MTAQVVTVYTKPDCPQCDATIKHLTSRAIPHTTVPIADAPTVAQAAQAQGWKSAPIVTVTLRGETLDMWGGYRPDRLSRLVHPVE